MSVKASSLPQLGTRLFLTDGGLETWLIFKEGMELPDFAAFVLLDAPGGRTALANYFERYIEIARKGGTGFILESPTWRASPDWGKRLGYDRYALTENNKDAIRLLQALKRSHETVEMPIVVSGCIGPRGDGYIAGEAISETEAQEYHSLQAEAFAEAEADMITAITMTNIPETIGLARAAEAAGLPAALSFTVETDGRLPSGDLLGEAILSVDAATDNYPAYYMINCAHPTHFGSILEAEPDWAKRLRGLRTNASKLSHAELDEAEELDEGDPDALGRENAALARKLPNLTVLGGCCGTDHRHVERMCVEAQKPV